MSEPTMKDTERLSDEISGLRTQINSLHTTINAQNRCVSDAEKMVEKIKKEAAITILQCKADADKSVLVAKNEVREIAAKNLTLSNALLSKVSDVSQLSEENRSAIRIVISNKMKGLLGIQRGLSESVSIDDLLNGIKGLRNENERLKKDLDKQDKLIEKINDLTGGRYYC